jgi:hypothetical protein
MSNSQHPELVVITGASAGTGRAPVSGDSIPTSQSPPTGPPTCGSRYRGHTMQGVPTALARMNAAHSFGHSCIASGCSPAASRLACSGGRVRMGTRAALRKTLAGIACAEAWRPTPTDGICMRSAGCLAWHKKHCAQCHHHRLNEGLCPGHRCRKAARQDDIKPRTKP